jgi:hypothetical protein
MPAANGTQRACSCISSRFDICIRDPIILWLRLRPPTARPRRSARNLTAFVRHASISAGRQGMAHETNNASPAELLRPQLHPIVTFAITASETIIITSDNVSNRNHNCDCDRNHQVTLYQFVSMFAKARCAGTHRHSRSYGDPDSGAHGVEVTKRHRFVNLGREFPILRRLPAACGLFRL